MHQRILCIASKRFRLPIGALSSSRVSTAPTLSHLSPSPFTSSKHRFYSSSSPLPPVDGEITYLDVPFEEKEEVKSIGGKWDAEAKKWYRPPDLNPDLFIKWERVYLNVPFDDKEMVKAMGAHWDPDIKKWYVRGGMNLSDFEQWWV